MQCPTGSRVRPLLWAVIACPLTTAHAQESPQDEAYDERPLDEIIVSVDREGKRVDINARRLEEIRVTVMREFDFQQFKDEEEEFRLRLRSSSLRNTSRLAWGYDAQAEAARIPTLQSHLLPIDRVRPATVVSFRF